MKFLRFSLLLSIFLTTTCSFADQAAVAAEQSPLSSFLFFGVMFAVFYLFMIRPQSKKAKEHKNLVASITKGDEVITNGGILGKISKVTDSFLVLSVSEGVEITVQKNAVATALPKGTIKAI